MMVVGWPFGPWAPAPWMMPRQRSAMATDFARFKWFPCQPSAPPSGRSLGRPVSEAESFLHDMVDPVFFHAAANQISLRAAGVDGYVFTGMGFGIHRDDRLLQVVEGRRVDAAQVLAARVARGARAILVTEGGVGHAVSGLARVGRSTINRRYFPGEPENVVAAVRITSDGEGVAVVCSDDDQGLAWIGHVVGLLDCLGELDGVDQGAFGVAGMVGVVDTAAFDMQTIAVLVVLQQGDGL